MLPLPPWRLQVRQDAASRQALEQALQAPVLVFTSPAAVRAAAALQAFSVQPAQQWLAVGAGTAAALRRAGIARVQAPSRMDTEGLLSLPALAGATRVGLVTAPGGRGLLAATLDGRGVPVDRADVYQRVPVPLPEAAISRLEALQSPACMALSSEEALRLVLAQLPPAAARVLQRAPVAAASQRLADIARELGWQRLVVAGSPRPAALARAAVQALSTKV